MPKKVVSKVRVELTRGHPHRFLSSTLVVGACTLTARMLHIVNPLLEGEKEMPARSGKEYILRLKEHPREVWLDGEHVSDVTTHPAFRNGVKSIAALYDMQNDPALLEEMTFHSPSTGQPVGLSFLIPETMEDLVRRRLMMERWAWASCGM
ncbi:MAG: hypothetical protein NZ807_07795, partial [Dehalococcoidia bacterium]|nr:hypothetical protein [Dehalococcoidia bacterium]